MLGPPLRQPLWVGSQPGQHSRRLAGALHHRVGQGDVRIELEIHPQWLGINPWGWCRELFG